MKTKPQLSMFILLLMLSVMVGAVNARAYSGDEPETKRSTANKSTTYKTLADPVAGQTYSYSFATDSEFPHGTSLDNYETVDGMLTLKNNAGSAITWHDPTHGISMYNGNSFEIKVAGNAIITFITCQYSADEAVFSIANGGSSLGTVAAESNGGTDAFAVTFAYTGAAGTITATLQTTGGTGPVYIHGLSIENAPAVDPSNGKIDVWDFGAEHLDGAIYNNKLTESDINAWYGSTAPGTLGVVLPSSFTAGTVSWTGGNNDRLRTTNTNLTRYDANIAGVSGYTGRLYVNSGANTSRYLSLALSEDDEVTLITKTDAGGIINFMYMTDPATQTDQISITSDLTELKFVAREAGTYRIFDTQGKPSYFRIYRKDAVYASIAGTVDVTQAVDIPNGYAVQFTNEAGKTWSYVVSSDAFTASLPVGYTYTLSLADANGYIISNGTELEVTESTTSYNVVIEELILHTVSGTITGLGDKLANLTLVYTPDPEAGKIYEPDPIIDVDNGTYTVQLEPNTAYTISALGVNDFYIPDNTITVTSNETKSVDFAAKPLHTITVNVSGLTASQLTKLHLTFSNMNEAGYVYQFSDVNSVALRDGTFTVTSSGLEDEPVQMALTSYLKVEGAAKTKNLAFNEVKVWSFDDQVITNATSHYKGLEFTGNIANEIAKGHLNCKSGATIKVPVKVGDKLLVTYYYTADFSIEGGTSFTTTSNSTSLLEYAEYTYPGSSDGIVTITIGAGASTTYLTEIAIGEIVPYSATITVGEDKDYATINEALAAVAKMNRPGNERVTILIDPGDYEEMLVINVKNVTLKNAASEPDINLLNKGVDIGSGAVRVTSYYGHGYSYYSMGSDQKWHADILQVNKENGSLSYVNKGAGTTNGSYWNATVVVFGSGVEAEDIIFENSFNQYISKKESEDVVVMWEVGNKGERPTDYGNTSVQSRSFVERGAALSIGTNVDKVVLKRCRVVGRQDSFYGGSGSRVVVYRGAMMGAVDYIFGGMIAVFYKTDLVMNTSDDASDQSYLTAAQQNSGRGYLMYECTVTSPEPGVETASTFHAKPGYFGRPWQATTSEVVFYKTTVKASDYTGFEGKSLISPAGWTNSLGGESSKMYEYGTIEESGEDNSASRASWSTVLSTPVLTDGTDITTFNFTKGSDNWDPIGEPGLLDDNSTLKSLAITEGTLQPAFDPSVTSYTLSVQDGTTSLTISAEAASQYSQVDIGTFSSLPGSDKVTVTAEDGSTTEYTITISIVTGMPESLESNMHVYPNPMDKGISHVSFYLSRPSDVGVQVVSTTGAVAQSLHAGNLSAGKHELKLDCTNLPTGLYIVKVVTAGESGNVRLMVK